LRVRRASSSTTGLLFLSRCYLGSVQSVATYSKKEGSGSKIATRLKTPPAGKKRPGAQRTFPSRSSLLPGRATTDLRLPRKPQWTSFLPTVNKGYIVSTSPDARSAISRTATPSSYSQQAPLRYTCTVHTTRSVFSPFERPSLYSSTR